MPPALSDAALRAAKPAAKPYRLYDSGGLYVEVAKTGSRLWRLKYRFGGKEKRLALGSYPATGLKDARAKAQKARELLDNGIDPSIEKKAAKVALNVSQGNSVEIIAREWFKHNLDKWVPSHSDKILRRLERDVFPWIGARPVSSITAADVLSVIRRIEARGVTETAHRAAQNLGQVFRFAIATGRADRNPVPDLKGALVSAKTEHFAAITKPAELGALLRSFDEFKGTHHVRAALLLSPLLFVRPGELRSARWSDMDLERGEWKFTTSKTNTEHLVPLAPQAVAILSDLQKLTGKGVFVFPGRGDRCMSEAAVNVALRRLGYDTRTEVTGHGFRATARTLLAEELNVAPEVIEHQLAHAVPDTLGRAYNRTKYLKDRREMMTRWADYLDHLKAGGVVLPFRGERRG
jgi:integrase